LGVSTVETNRDRDGDFLTYRDVGESRGLVVKAEDSQLSGCGFKPWHCILDGVSEAGYYKLQWKNEIKVAKWAHQKNI
jgi:hypothetical protein